MIMVYDFLQLFKTYDKNIYNQAYFKFTACPVCPAIGRFKMYGSYRRYAIFFIDNEMTHEFIDIKRILCLSCGTTHAVVPGDLIPYKVISLFVFIFILVSFYLKKKPVLQTVKRWSLSFQFIYCVIHTFNTYINHIRQYLREIYPETIPLNIDINSVLAIIKEQSIKFQSGYIKFNRKPCFMCKFIDRTGIPPVGLFVAKHVAT